MVVLMLVVFLKAFSWREPESSLRQLFARNAM